MNKCVLLCVDDDKTVLSALRTLLSKSLGDDVTVEVAESGQEALEVHQELADAGQHIGVVISDFIMPSMRGDELLVRLHERHPRMVKIMLTGQSSLDGVKRTINEANLYRFIEKPFNNADLVLTARSAVLAYRQGLELEHRNAELLRINRDLEAIVAERTAELVEKNQQLSQLSVTDRLTGLSNRLKLDQTLEAEFQRSQRTGASLSVILTDVDHFKSVNDTHGHQTGDEVLVGIANLLKAGARQIDVVGRWGGEEFLLVCPDTDADSAKAVAERLRQAISTHAFPAVGQKTASFGVATLQAEDSITALIARADKALYQAKAAGRNRVESAK
jgi:diguanylate cyclase (GGDEF)-like protein